jgi:CDP-diglyceride synthetase
MPAATPVFALPGWLAANWTTGLVATVLPILCIVAADTFAYLGGRAFGKTPLITISPKKTVEAGGPQGRRIGSALAAAL